MDLHFEKISFEEDVKIICDLLCLGQEHSRVKEYICKNLGIGFQEFEEIEKDKKIQLVSAALEKEYRLHNSEIDGKLACLSDEWHNEKVVIMENLQNIFECPNMELEDIYVNLSFNWVCPYDYNNRKIYLNYRKSTEELLEACIHELIHFYWFAKWDVLFGNKYDKQLVWKFSEIAIDSIFVESELKKYCVSQYPAHEHFYDISIGNNNLIEYFRGLFCGHCIRDFMEEGIVLLEKYCEEEGCLL